jgi:hypothetical protein
MASLVEQKPRAAGRKALARAAHLLASFPASGRFQPYTLSVYAWPAETWADKSPKNSLQRSFRFELDGCCSHLTLFAGRDSSWRRQIVGRLVRAGYERWLVGDDSVDLRRWLRGRNERLRELAFLRTLGREGAAMRWPKRRAVARPVAVKHGRWTRRIWQRVIRDVADAGIPWNDAAIGVSRVGLVGKLVRSRELHVVVGALAFDGGRLVVFASASLAGGQTPWEPLPPSLARSLRRVLSAAGFKPDGARSSNGRRILALLPQPWRRRADG